MTTRVVGLLVAVAVVLAVGPLPAAVADRPVPTGAERAVPCPHGRPVGPHVACTGPVTRHAGGGGGTLTLGLSVVVGVAVAAGAVLIVRQRIALDAARPRPAGRQKRPS